MLVHTGHPSVEGLPVVVPAEGGRIVSRRLPDQYDATVTRTVVADGVMTVHYVTDDGEAGSLTYRVREV